MIKKYLKKIDIIYSLVLFFREFKILSKDVMFKNALGFKFKRKYNPHFLDTFELFNQYSYSCYMISEKIECIDIARIKNIMKTKINDLDSHNFLFIDSKNKTLLKQLFKN